MEVQLASPVWSLQELPITYKIKSTLLRMPSKASHVLVPPTFSSHLLCIRFPVLAFSLIYPKMLGVLAISWSFTPLCVNKVLFHFSLVFNSSRGITLPWAISITISIGKEYTLCRKGSIIWGPNAKWKCGAPCSKIIKNFRTVTAEHELKQGPY